MKRTISTTPLGARSPYRKPQTYWPTNVHLAQYDFPPTRLRKNERKHVCHSSSDISGTVGSNSPSTTRGQLSATISEAFPEKLSLAESVWISLTVRARVLAIFVVGRRENNRIRVYSEKINFISFFERCIIKIKLMEYVEYEERIISRCISSTSYSIYRSFLFVSTIIQVDELII